MSSNEDATETDSDDALLARGMLIALGAMVRAMAATHPEPDVLSARFAAFSDQLLSNLEGEEEERLQIAVRCQLEVLKTHLRSP